MHDPSYDLTLPRSTAMFLLSLAAKVPIEQGLDHFNALREQIIRAEEMERVAAARSMVARMDSPGAT